MLEHDRSNFLIIQCSGDSLLKLRYEVIIQTTDRVPAAKLGTEYYNAV